MKIPDLFSYLYRSYSTLLDEVAYHYIALFPKAVLDPYKKLKRDNNVLHLKCKMFYIFSNAYSDHSRNSI